MKDEKQPLLEHNDSTKPIIATKGSSYDQEAARSDTRPSRYVYALASCAVLNTCNVGFDIGVNSPAGILIQQDLRLSDWQLELFMGSINLFSLWGAMGNSWLVVRWGMKASFVLSSCLFLVGTLLVVLANRDHFIIILLGRTLVGLGNGFGCAVTPQYISEVSPKEHRGFLTSWAEISCNVGILIGFSMGFVFAQVRPGLSWRLMFAMGCILPIVMILLCWFVMVESPRWLVQQQQVDRAHVVLQKLLPEATPNALQDIIQDIQFDIERDHVITGTQQQEVQQQQQQRSGLLGWIALIRQARRQPAVRKMLHLGVGIAVAHEISGIDAIQYYLAFILNASGVTSREAQGRFLFGLGFVKLATLFVASALVDKLGRRPLLLVSLSGMVVSLLVVAASFQNSESKSDVLNNTTAASTEATNELAVGGKDNNYYSDLFVVATISGLGFYLIFFSLGLGPLGWLLPPELFSTSIRSNAVSMSTSTNRLTATFMTSTMLSLAHWLSWVGYFISLAVVNLSIAVWVWLYLPETKGVKLEDVGTFFHQ
ncbi:hypothetical protein ACA910_004278 [Epithemia clementina (nom. ined.)]